MFCLSVCGGGRTKVRFSLPPSFLFSLFRAAIYLLQWQSRADSERANSLSPTPTSGFRLSTTGQTEFDLVLKRSIFAKEVQSREKRFVGSCEKCLPDPAWLLLSKTCKPFLSPLYRTGCLFKLNDWVEFAFGYSVHCLFLLGPLVDWQKWLGNMAEHLKT